MEKLFGTDGIRGKANEYPITPEMAINIGRAIAHYFKKDNGQTKILIGKDTRISGDMIESGLLSGICSMGVDSYVTGIIPTPGVAYLTSSTDMDAGIVISASHNPYDDNGIKIFNQDGFKLSIEEEEEIEALIFNKELPSICRSIHETGSIHQFDDAETKYRSFLKQVIPETCLFKNLKLVIDCSNGATYRIAPDLFEIFGAEVESLFIRPNGININDHCGSQHPESLADRVVQSNADVGFAFDGDGDRLIAIDEKGSIITGDQILAINAEYMKHINQLQNNIVVSTIMSNMGLGTALKKIGVEHTMTKVGDRHVMEQMIASGAVLGGEDSGHTIFLNHHTTGDGMLAALKLLEIMTVSSKPLSELSKVMTIFPQKLINVDVKEKPELMSVQKIAEAIRSVENELGQRGRVLVRYSGTQPCCRVMVEGESVEETTRYCNQIADIIRDTLN